jgi:menaquinone-9 beta-reductase
VKGSGNAHGLDSPSGMPVRATKRGAERTPLGGEYDVLVCGASFAGLAVARELSGAGARVALIDRYAIGERQTSACAAPTEWLVNLGLDGAIRQTFGEIVVHRPKGAPHRWRLPWTFSTFDYPELCALLKAQSPDVAFDTAKVDGRTREGAAHVVHTDRGDLRAPLVVDALGWRRVLSNAGPIQPPDALLSRGLEVHPPATGEDLELWLDPKYVPAGYGWAFPARDEVRVGVGSFDPHKHVKDETVQLTRDVGLEPAGYQGNWPRTACSSRGTPPGTACRPPRRASARRSTSGWPAGASCVPWWRAARRATRRWSATARSPSGTPGSSAGCCAPSGRSAASTGGR